jgi:hypothetical protein
MVLHHTQDIRVVRRRDLVRTALVFIAAVLLLPTLGAAQGPLERFKEDIKGELKDVKEDVREEVAYLLGWKRTSTAIRW